jgi:hypothetical protein
LAALGASQKQLKIQETDFALKASLVLEWQPLPKGISELATLFIVALGASQNLMQLHQITFALKASLVLEWQPLPKENSELAAPSKQPLLGNFFLLVSRTCLPQFLTTIAAFPHS